MQNMTDIISNVRDTAVKVYDSRGEVHEVSMNTSASLREISGNVEAMTEQIAQLNENIETSMNEIHSINDSIGALEQRLEKEIHEIKQSTSAIQEMSFLINSVTKISTEKREAVEKVSKVLVEGGEKISQTNAFVSEISNAVDEMLGVITMINNIASQTNLLSMNAAIEAAHAGDAGTGFAVVAEEIRGLSDSTNENAKKIKEVLKRVTERAKGAQTQSDLSKEFFNTVQEEVNGFTTAFTEIVSTMQELSAGSGELITSAEGITTFLQQLKEETDTIASNSGTLENTIGDIGTVSSKVLGEMREIEQATREVADGMNTVEEINKKNSENVDKLYNDVTSIDI
jgi:methyl-accepting chemotaxis protein